MLSHHILQRSISPQSTSPSILAQFQSTRLLHAIQPAPDVRFESASTGGAAVSLPTHATVSSRIKRGREDEAQDEDGGAGRGESERKIVAHRAGINSITVDRFEGR